MSGDEENPMDQQRLLGGRYEVGELLGRGGMAEVHAGRDTRLGRTVAIKSLRVDLARDPSFRARFRREAQSAASLNHPNIVAIYDTGEESVDTGGGPLAVPYLVMEPVEGTTLRALLADGNRLLPERALEITSGVLAALAYSHHAGIVHRDIKPANVMLTDDGKVKVMDFGIARAVADSASTMTQTGATLGTAQYLSPEQAQGGAIDPRSDIYSAGCLLYELLTTRPPFTGDTPVSVAYQHVRENPVPPSQVDPEVTPAIDAIVMKALAKNPDNRYQSADEMREDIQAAIGGRPVAATPVMDETRAMSTVAATDVTPDDARGSSRGRRAWFVLLGVAVAALIVGGLWAVLNLGGSGKQVTVPDLSGLTITQATEALNAKGLALGEIAEQASERPADTIIDQDPRPPASITEGSSVDVVISLGPAQTKVPVLVGLTLEDALSRLDDARLVAATPTRKASSRPEGEVIAVDPEEGTEVAEGSSVALTVSNGRVKVPAVVGELEGQATATLENAGFDVVPLSQVTFDEDQVGRVLSQNPADGTAPSGSTVTITVGVAPPPTPTPTPPSTPTPTPPSTPTSEAD